MVGISRKILLHILRIGLNLVTNKLYQGIEDEIELALLLEQAFLHLVSYHPMSNVHNKESQ